MYSTEFVGFAKLVAELWPRWAHHDEKNPGKSNWNTHNQAMVFDLLKAYELRACEDAIKKQRRFDPDATKPSWGALTNELRSQAQQRKTPEEIALEERAVRENRRMRAWGHANKHRMDGIEQEVYRHRPKLRDAIAYARKLHGDARVWMCERWDTGDRFEDFASEDDVDAEMVFASVPQDDIPF